MKRLAALLALLFATNANAVSHSWVNDGSDGWAIGESWDVDNIDAVKDTLDLILGEYTEFSATTGLTYSPSAWTETLAGGATHGRIKEEFWNVPSVTYTGASKSTVVGRYLNTYSLSGGETYMAYKQMFCGAGSDCIGEMWRIFGTGGSQVSGDEGIQGLRMASYDSWGIASGTLGGNIAAGAATTSTAISGVAAADAKMMGERKLIVFTGTKTAVNIVTRANGAIDATGAVQASGTGGAYGAASGGVWELGTGEVASASVGIGDCFKADLSDFTGYFSADAIEGWLYITAVSGDTITTEWISQGSDYRVPYGYLADEDTGATEGYVAACGKTGAPTLDASYAVTSVPITTGSGFPGAVSTDAFEVHPYPGNTLIDGITSRVGRMYGGPGEKLGHAFMAMNSLQDGIGRMQLDAGLNIRYSGDTSALEDGTDHAFRYGVKCTRGACESGVRYSYSDTAGLDQQFGKASFGSTTWDGTGNDFEVIEVLDGEALTSFDLTVNDADGWGQSGDVFVRESHIGSTVQAYDADLSDLADGSLSGSKIGTGLDASTITTGTIASTARLPAAVIESSEIDTSSELNAIILDTDFLTASGTYDISVTGSAAFTGTLRGGVSVTIVSATTATLLSTTALGDLYNCTNAAGCDITLPAAAAGLNFCARDANGGGVVTIDAAAGDEIELDGVGVGVADAIDSAGAKGDFICLLALDGTTWASMGRSGTWVDGGAD